MSETGKLLDHLVPLAQAIANMSSRLLELSAGVGVEEEDVVRSLVLEIRKQEENADSIFEGVATEIMEVDYLNINPDHLLDIAKRLDQISDLIERTALLFQYLTKFHDDEIRELLSSCSAQISGLSEEFLQCLKVLDLDTREVSRLSELISDREKVVDEIRERFNSYATKKMGMSEFRIWLKDIFACMDEIADLSRDLTITFRVVAMKLERQRTFTPKTTAKT